MGQRVSRVAKWAVTFPVLLPWCNRIQPRTPPFLCEGGEGILTPPVPRTCSPWRERERERESNRVLVPPLAQALSAVPELRPPPSDPCFLSPPAINAIHTETLLSSPLPPTSSHNAMCEMPSPASGLPFSPDLRPCFLAKSFPIENFRGD